MEHDISMHSVYTNGAARFDDLIYLSIKDRSLEADDVEHSRLIGFQGGELGHMADTNWTSIAMCVVKRPSEKLIAISEDGEVFTYVKGTSQTEQITPNPSVLRGLGVVDGQAYACGMNRESFKREDEGVWMPMHAAVSDNAPKGGFEAITGFSAGEIYAVGWNGEIWKWDGSLWNNQPTPTNVILTGACAADDELVYICGQRGIIIRGRNDQWELVAVDELSEDLWDICCFDGDIYISSMTDVYKLVDGRIEPLDFGDDRPETTYRLTHAQGVLWSIGSDNVFSFDGSTWTRFD